MEQQREIVRRAGLLERYHITRHSLGLDSCVLVAAQYIPPKPCRLDKATLFHALREVVESHAALGVRLAGEFSESPSYERLEKINLDEVVEFTDSCDLKATIEAQLLRPFHTASTLPLWRIVVLKDNTICFAWHHCIGDGKSGLAFHRALLASFRRVGGCGPIAKYIAIPSTNAFVPPIETLVNLTPPWRKVGLGLFELFCPTSWTRGASAWTGNPVKDASLQTSVRLIKIIPDQASMFLALCRSHKATLTSAFHVLGISVLSALISAEKHKTIACSIPISIRGLSGTSSDAFCEQVSTMNIYSRIDPVFSWTEASRCALALQSYIPKSVEEIGMLKFLFGKYEAYFKGQLGKKREGGLELSNVGRFEVESNKDGDAAWLTGGMVFAQCNAALGAAVKMNMVGDALGGITIAVTWGVDAIPDGFGEEFVARFRDSFERILSKEVANVSFSVIDAV
ncbi:alcohol acetyltransferase [Lyophyllum atratum]|nr:alcohol acetyltransferase [Lyophyllum atratum]